MKTYVIEIFEIKTQEGYYLKQIGSNNNKNDNDNSDNDNNSYWASNKHKERSEERRES